MALCDFAMGALARLFADCRVTPMRDRDHFLFYYRFLNTNLQTTDIDPLDLFDPGYSIQQNCLHAEGIAHSGEAGISFRLDCYHHAIFAVRQWPRRTFPGIIAALTGMGFQEYAITMNVFPKRVDKVIEREEQHIQRLQIDSISERKQSLVTDMLAKQEKVTELQQGKVIPLNCSLCGSALAQKHRSAGGPMRLAQERIDFHGRRGDSPRNYSRKRASALLSDLARMDVWHLSRVRSGRRRFLPWQT